jgi:hypothetical protein
LLWAHFYEFWQKNMCICPDFKLSGLIISDSSEEIICNETNFYSERKLLGQNRTNALWDEQTDHRLLTRRTGEKSRAKEKKEY